MSILTGSRPPSTDTIPDKLDQKRLLQLYADDTDMLITHIELFLGEVIPQFQELEERIHLMDWAGVRSLTHQLRPWLGMVGLTDLENKLWEMERIAGNRPDRETLLALWGTFKEKLRQMTLVLNSELERMK